MLLRNKIRFTGAIVLLGIMGLAGNLSARENVVSTHRKSQLKASASGCLPASEALDLDINNVRARLMTGGDMWWNIGVGGAAYEIPKGSGKSSQFAASCWIGGYDKQGQLKVAAQTYRQDGNDYWPGALDVNAKITSDQCAQWDRFWKVDRSTINKFIELSKISGNTTTSEFDAINQWPATGNPNVKAKGGVSNISLNVNNSYAPFKDINGNGVYEPSKGEYPLITGDQYIWWVFNDAGNIKQQSITAAMGIEVQTSAFAYATQDFLNNATFYNYRVINRGPLTIDSTFIAVWDDADLGYYLDDFIGCDTSRGLGILYNGTNDDGAPSHPVNSYGLTPPQVALDFFKGPLRPVKRAGLPDTVEQLRMTNFTYYNNDASSIGNPDNGVQIYNYMTGSIRNGQRFADDFQGPGVPSKGYGSGPVSNFVFWGDPGNASEWSECACANPPGDRRFVFSSGPFQLLSGAINDITIGVVWAKGVGGCPSTNFKTIKNVDDQAQALFDNKFKTVEGPEAPRMVVRELDRKLIVYLVNDYGSNNYGENYGRSDSSYKDSLQYHQIVVKAQGNKDSLYRFQGYRVFQLANSQVTASEIFDPNTGEVDNTKAYEVFQCDVHDSVKQIVNYVKNINISDTTHIPQIKVNGKDSGIVHSFVLTNDQFATGSDKRFINYHNYYFVAIAYAYNNFSSFDSRNTVSTQDVPYLGSSHGAGGIDVPKLTVMPNPANGDMGTILNADYGSGVEITRVEGMGNGGNIIQLDAASEAAAVADGKVDKATYVAGQGPIDVKVVDPLLVPKYNWVLQIAGADSLIVADSTRRIRNKATWRLTALENGRPVDTIYSETTLAGVNEQILQKYGLSVSVTQVGTPGSNNQLDGNGYLTSDITFDDPSTPWLWGVQDQNDSSFSNWLRSGNVQKFKTPSPPNTTTDPRGNPCYFNDYMKLDVNSNYGNMLDNFTPTKSTWGPYCLASAWAFYHLTNSAGAGSPCGFDIAYSPRTQDIGHFQALPDVDLVFTSDKSKWTRVAVIEEQEDSTLAEGNALKFLLRRHRSWNGDLNTDGVSPKYAESDTDRGMSWFPGYAVDQNTGKRLNIVFGEDSYLTSDNGGDMIWNPSSVKFNPFDNSIIYGGKHIVYILNSAYDSDKVFVANVKKYYTSNVFLQRAYEPMQWIGVPTSNPTVPMLSLKDGLIPTTTRLRFRVKRPYSSYHAVADTNNIPDVKVIPGMATNPYYTFSTSGLAKIAKSDTTDRTRILNRIYAVPNPYYGYSGWERNRYDTKVRIINLPSKVTINIYSLDGTLVRTLSKNDNTSYIDWDIRNSVGLPISSGMYLMDVKAEGLGETVIKWFGAARPLDVTTY